MLCQSFSILGAEAITPADVVVQVQPVQRLECSRLFNPGGPELPRARRVGHPIRANRACSAGCLPPTSNPVARAARAVPRPTRIVLFGAARREIPLVELAIIGLQGRLPVCRDRKSIQIYVSKSGQTFVNK